MSRIKHKREGPVIAHIAPPVDDGKELSVDQRHIRREGLFVAAFNTRCILAWGAAAYLADVHVDDLIDLADDHSGHEEEHAKLVKKYQRRLAKLDCYRTALLIWVQYLNTKGLDVTIGDELSVNIIEDGEVTRSAIKRSLLEEHIDAHPDLADDFEQCDKLEACYKRRIPEYIDVMRRIGFITESRVRGRGNKILINATDKLDEFMAEHHGQLLGLIY